MPRLFVALRPPPPVRQRLRALGTGIPGARWQDDEQLHLTLRFIGDIDRPLAEDVAAALGGVHAPVPAVSITGVGRFEHRGRIEALWAGVAPSEALRHLHRKVEQACVRAGLPPERRAFLPHVTLARFSRSAGVAPEIGGWLAMHAGLALPAFPSSHIVLYESHLGSAGASYTPVARWPLDVG
ncbi:MULTISPECIES: RNA 2',3'-cyclic phosphodiesterase [unclassified Sphingomonas]|jgi:RNA 2',3'-cyclic 3'-phosphodiesterase|uniref:RNA 2',3'-cyclic phosphodiesterase n=1 Tax=unclassified Sphingomonas TaxID=196159 RepID=UPI000E10798A|nr:MULTISPECIES: RNA 2',3'-cyclic phosphodiesterase [unclassified Sphingomonas]AXJ94646.1 RNA 2',3'-cyclic phosphodiesterase [Sphingomonas sp. FARSPH]